MLVAVQTAEELSPADRRKFARIACPPDASVRLRTGMSARLLDVGLGGALVESSTRLVLGSVHATMFVAPDIAFRARAHIVRAFVAGVTRGDSGGSALLYRAGLEFSELSPTEAGTLGTFVSSALRSVPQTTVAAPPDRTVSIRFPSGWNVCRKQGAFVARAPHSQSYVFVGTPQGSGDGDLGERARASMRDAGFSALHGQAAEINGLPAWVGFYSGRLDDLGVVIVEAAHIVLNGRTYLVAGVAPWAAYETVRHEFFAAIDSFGRQPEVDGACIVAAPSCHPAGVVDFSTAALAGSVC